MSRAEQEKYIHPIVQKALAKQDWYREKSKGGKSGEIDYKPRKIITINGKVVGSAGGGYKPPERNPAPAAPSAPPTGMINSAEVARVATERRESLTEKMLTQHMDQLVQNKGATAANDAISAAERAAEESGSGVQPRVVERQRSQSIKPGVNPLFANPPPMPGAFKLPMFAAGMPPSSASRATVGHVGGQVNDDEMAHVAPQADGLAAQQQAMWDRMQEKHLGPAQEAELAHVRNMIECLTKSLEGYRKAERDLLMADRK